MKRFTLTDSLILATLAILSVAWSQGWLSGAILVLFGIAITVAEVAVGFAVNGEGVILRVAREGTANVVAVDDGTGLSSSVAVLVLPYTIDQLRIVIEGAEFMSG